ncbi:hypothetical protein B0H19DRAFT_403501 [Mycena capillaripes]|nr:hypothetical protein B0H19DRAFT_403501 [Mycena capillaripes]
MTLARQFPRPQLYVGAIRQIFRTDPGYAEVERLEGVFLSMLVNWSRYGAHSSQVSGVMKYLFLRVGKHNLLPLARHDPAPHLLLECLLRSPRWVQPCVAIGFCPRRPGTRRCMCRRFPLLHRCPAPAPPCIRHLHALVPFPPALRIPTRLRGLPLRLPRLPLDLLLRPLLHRLLRLLFLVIRPTAVLFLPDPRVGWEVSTCKRKREREGRE